MALKNFSEKISRAREASNKSHGVNSDLFVGGTGVAVTAVPRRQIADPEPGTTFGRWVAAGAVVKRGGARLLPVVCSCGSQSEPVLRHLGNLVRGLSRSCGCIPRDAPQALTHGHARNRQVTAELNTWYLMRRRCLDENVADYPLYGGRGIRVCDTWLENFSAFYADMGPKPSRGHSLERVDNEGDYCPENCIWATLKQQARNKRNTVWVIWNGSTLSLAEAAERAGIPYKRAWKMMKRGEQFVRTEKPA